MLLEVTPRYKEVSEEMGRIDLRKRVKEEGPNPKSLQKIKEEPL